ncbi:MAG: hypothetical protein WBF90_04225 [Rivularia sp. (in: cyanobacteria)]
MKQLQLRTDTLKKLGATSSEVAELLAYNDNVFETDKWQFSQTLPIASEDYIEAWQGYIIEAQNIGAYEILKQVLVQLQFPILSGISKTKEYLAATLQGKFANLTNNSVELTLNEPEKIEIKIHQTLSGLIPIIIIGNRQDFVAFVQAITKRNEPQPIPDSMGACIVSGYNNWNRIYEYKKLWEAQQQENHRFQTKWSREFKRLIACKELYQDKFILLSTGNYSNIPASQLGLTEIEWQKLSVQIRLEHESTHYFTHRFFGSMRNNLLDELIADYRGIVAAVGNYRADWFLHFIGLESFPNYRQGGRLENYRGEPPLSGGAFKILQALLVHAAKNLENFDKQFFANSRTVADEVTTLLALSKLTLEELANPQTTLNLVK